MKLTEEQIKEIAEEIDTEMRCFYNVKTGKIEVIPDLDNNGWIGIDTELFQDILDELDENWDDYFEFEKITSHESFEIMADFAETVDNNELRNRLYNALNKPKPFRNFKWEIDDAGEYRQKWFDFKLQKLIEFVKNQIDEYNQEFS